MTRTCRVALGVVVGLLWTSVVLGQRPAVRVTYLYDNTAAVPGVTPHWGFACLVEAHGRRVLFDTGANAKTFQDNVTALKVDLQRIDALVLSHDHGDHTQGLAALGSRPGLPVYYAQGFAPQVVARLTEAGFKKVPVSRAVPIFPGIGVSDEMALESPAAGARIVEDALLVETAEGLVVIVGCAHPGIVTMLKQIRASSGQPIHMVLGGFHLSQTPADHVRHIIADFKSLGVAYAGPTHCTGEDAIRLFREAYGDHFIPGGVGRVVEAPRLVERWTP